MNKTMALFYLIGFGHNNNDNNNNNNNNILVLT